MPPHFRQHGQRAEIKSRATFFHFLDASLRRAPNEKASFRAHWLRTFLTRPAQLLDAMLLRRKLSSRSRLGTG